MQLKLLLEILCVHQPVEDGTHSGGKCGVGWDAAPLLSVSRVREQTSHLPVN